MVLRYERYCCIVGGVVVVVAVEERRFARAMKVGAGADVSGRRTAELLKVTASGCGIVPSCNTVLLPGHGVARRRGEYWSAAAFGGGIARATLMRGGGG